MLQVTAVGYLAADPTLREFDNDRQVANFRLLVNKTVKGDQVTNEIQCAVWGARAKVVMDYLRVGSQVTVTGQGLLESFMRKTGEPGACFNLAVSDFSLPPKPQTVAPEDMPF